MSTPEHCDADGKGGCAKHPPTMCLQVHTQAEHGVATLWYWHVDSECPGRRCVWPARVDYDIPLTAVPAQAESMAQAYNWLLHPKQNREHTLRRIRAAEKLRAKGKIVAGMTFKG